MAYLGASVSKTDNEPATESLRPFKLFCWPYVRIMNFECQGYLKQYQRINTSVGCQTRRGKLSSSGRKLKMIARMVGSLGPALLCEVRVGIV